MAAPDFDKENGKAVKEIARDILKEIDMARHLEQPTPNEEELDAILAKNNLSKDEKAQLNRWDIENLLMLPVHQNSVEFHHKGGLKKARLFELLNLPPEVARQIDEAEERAGVQPSNRQYLVKQRQALRDFFEIAGLDYLTGQGTATVETLTAAIEHLVAGDKIHLYNSWFKFGGYINPFSRKLKPINRAKTILEGLGLSLDTIQLGRLTADSKSRQRYVLADDDWDIMSEIHAKRVAAGVTAYKGEFLDGAMIHSSHDLYIDTMKEMDHVETAPKPAPHKESRVIKQLKQWAKELGISSDKEARLIVEMEAFGVVDEQHGLNVARTLISQRWGRFVEGLSPHKLPLTE